MYLHLPRHLVRSSAILFTIAVLFIFATPASANSSGSVAPMVKRIIPQTVCWPTSAQPIRNEAFILLGSGLNGATVTTDAPIFLPPNATGIDFAGHLLAQIFVIGFPPSTVPTGTFHLTITTPSGATSVPFTLRTCGGPPPPPTLPFSGSEGKQPRL